jgi:hypothetical protein
MRAGVPLEARLIPDERVVRRASVEAHAGPHQLTLIVAFFIAVTDDRHHRHDHRDVRQRAPRFRCSLSHIRHHVPRQTLRLAERMHMHPVRHFSRHPQPPRIHRRHINFRIRCIDRPRAPLRRDEVQVVELPVVIQRPRSKRDEARLDGQHIVTQPRRTCVPSPSRNFPTVASCNSHAVAAVTNGLRGNATDTLRYAVGPVSVNSRPEKPAACVHRARSPTLSSGCGTVITSTCTVEQYAGERVLAAMDLWTAFRPAPPCRTSMSRSGTKHREANASHAHPLGGRELCMPSECIVSEKSLPESRVSGH